MFAGPSLNQSMWHRSIFRTSLKRVSLSLYKASISVSYPSLKVLILWFWDEAQTPVFSESPPRQFWI